MEEEHLKVERRRKSVKGKSVGLCSCRTSSSARAPLPFVKHPAAPRPAHAQALDPRLAVR